MPTGNAVVDQALAAHGGEARWAKLAAIKTTWTFHGMMFKLRLREGRLKQLSARIDTRAPKVEVSPYMRPATRGLFAPDHLEIATDGAATRTQEHPRDAFKSVRTLAWWNDFEMLYFAGYVLWNYAQLPFLLRWPGLTLEDVGTSKQGAETWNKVRVTFPPEVPTHSAEQFFYFGPDGTLRRHDYSVSIMSRLARGARYIHAYHDVDGLKLPARIEIKLGTVGESYAPWPSLGFVEFDDYQLESA